MPQVTVTFVFDIDASSRRRIDAKSRIKCLDSTGKTIYAPRGEVVETATTWTVDGVERPTGWKVDVSGPDGDGCYTFERQIPACDRCELRVNVTIKTP